MKNSHMKNFKLVIWCMILIFTVNNQIANAQSDNKKMNSRLTAEQKEQYKSEAKASAIRLVNALKSNILRSP